jgi:transketolase
MGIAEQNMISVAAGLAKEGYHPVVYTIIPFLTMRAFEQIRVDVCMHMRNILLVGVGGGFAYDVLGPTHHALEDIAIMRSLPNMKIFTPSAPSHLKNTLSEIFLSSGPSYLRLGKNGERELEALMNFNESLGAFCTEKSGHVVFISHGAISEEVDRARKKLESFHGIKSTHFAVIRNEPVSTELFEQLNIGYEHIYFVEETYSIGSLYSQFCEFAINRLQRAQVHGLFASKNFYHRVANRKSIISSLKMDAESILKIVLDFERGD